MSYRPPKATFDRSREDAPPRVLVDAWREEPLDPLRVQRAFLRFRQRSATAAARPRASMVRWVTFGVAIGMGTVYAASALVPEGSAPSRLSARSAPQAAPPAVTPKSRPTAPLLVDQPALPSSFSLPPLESAQRPPSTVGSSEQWKRAAQSLRDRDFESASEALSELSRRGSREDRESALLVQAQVFLSQGKILEATELLRALQASATSESVRTKSAELLSRSAGLPSSRSFEAPAGTNLP